MSGPDASHLEVQGAAHRARTVVRNAFLILVGLVVGAIGGLVIAGYAGWLPRLNLC
jgi:hypothetical protein